MSGLNKPTDTTTTTSQKRKKAPKCIWTESDTKKLVELAEEHVGLLGEGGGYKPQFYNMAEGILAPLTTKGATKTADSIRNKWFSLKKELSCVDQLMNTSGLGFDVQCGLKITNANRHIWDAFLKSKSKDVKSTYNRLASDGWRWYNSITAILPSRAKGTHIFRASQAQSAKISSASKDRMDVDAEGNDGGEDGEDEDGEDKGDEEGAEREAIETEAVVSARKDKGKSGSESGTLYVSSIHSKPTSASVSITSSGKRKYSAIDSTSVISATPGKAPHSSGAAAINGVKEQMQRMADNKEQRDTKRDDFRYRFLNIVESAFTGSVSGGGSSNIASSLSSRHIEPLNTRSQAIRMAGQIETQLNDKQKVAFIDMLRADNVLIGDYLDMATQDKNLRIMWVDKLLKDFAAFPSN
ncbi:hypothetical protein SERLA73DRAFT_78441 [Serpula lacrymans var. lacrymans S7.3]|uniref:Myb/SANT-like domain-containing protein n=2 Tax=Serpula lacrymans var. lacrymans TaxID=341189 RepID=F8QD83_SERL3|nr:uncharacterized protein SERLADRAFT_411866 [Serpula lacrymans var. lacrymans S7.9]EGN93554.1 hypothetical protein SERLA73DRAFT_78441 [Serpula lacrymans var. lacrymans S7.3]EGO18929.1 hypothetical protein SERLADRAFT_411866 [Serpula lacrymans var. lacrymans S7.9]